MRVGGGSEGGGGSRSAEHSALEQQLALLQQVTARNSRLCGCKLALWLQCIVVCCSVLQ